MYSKCSTVFQMIAVVAKLWIQKLLGHMQDSLEEWTLLYLRHLELIWKFLCRLQKEQIPSVWWPMATFVSTCYQKRLYFFTVNLPAEHFFIYILLHSMNHHYKNLVLFCFYGTESAALPTVANSLCNVFHCSNNTSISSIVLAIYNFFF